MANSCVWLIAIIIVGIHPFGVEDTSHSNYQPASAYAAHNNPRSFSFDPYRANEHDSPAAEEDSRSQKTDDKWAKRSYYASLVAAIATVLLAITAIIGTCAGLKTLKTLGRQTAANVVSAKAAKISADAALLTAQSAINAERAYISGELVADVEAAMLSEVRYRIRVTNTGKTPAKLLRYRTDCECFVEGEKSKTLSTQRALYGLVGSDKSQILGEAIDPDMFEYCPSGEGRYGIIIFYEDVVNRDAEHRLHETAFVYRCISLTPKVERITVLDRYT